MTHRLTSGRILVLVAALVTAASCGGRGTSATIGLPAPVYPARTRAPVYPSPIQADREVIRRARMDVEVERLAPAQARLERAAAALGGRVAQLQTHEDERAEYLLRVPADRLDALMDSVGTLGSVESRSVSTTDVTEQLVDIDARVAALRASRDRLRQLLDRATSVESVIAVERELARVQGELDSLEGRRNSMRGQVALSELSVSLRRRPVLGPLGILFKALGDLLTKLFIWD